MAVSPIIDADDVVRISVKSDGAVLPDSVRFHSIDVRRAVGAIPTATLVVEDGEMPTGEWPVADSSSFVPGAEISISAGYGNSEELIFAGIVVRIGVQISGDNFSRLNVFCQDKAVKMTVGRKNANHIAKTDSDIISTLIGNAGLSAKVSATSTQYGELVQYYCTDWDFLMTRAEANGLLVIAEDGTVTVTDLTSPSAVLGLTWGTDIIDFQADIDARGQYASVQAIGWDPKTQSIVSATAPPASVTSAGDLKSAKLASVIGLDHFTLQSQTRQESAALTDWAKAQQQKAALARMRGRVSFQGSAKAKVGEAITLSGLGARFNGDVFIGGLQHEIRDGNWLTSVEFGVAADWFSQRSDIVAPPAAGWLPGGEGLQTGIVMKLEADPDGEHRVQVKLPVLDAESPGVWARLLQYSASNSFGAFYLPEIGDEVVLAFFNNDPSQPVVLGSLYSSKRAPPYQLADANDIKALVTRSQTRIEIDDKNKIVTISTPAKNKIVISDQDKKILVSDENGNTVTTSPEGIALDSPKNITITAKGKISISAVDDVSISSKKDLSESAINITASAKANFVAKGTASAEFSASGTTIVKGAMVMIN